MKNTRPITRKLSLTFVAVLAATTMSSCLNEYLDRSPDSGLSEEEVFSQFSNFQNYFYSVYYGTGVNIQPHYPLFFHRWDQKLTLESVTDMCDMARNQYAQAPKRGENSEGFAGRMGYYSNRAKVTYSWKAIRICNKTIENIDRVQDITTADYNDFLGQAYFVRAFSHFELFRFYGSLPYIDFSIDADDDWDFARLSAHDMLMRIADDFQKAADCFLQAGVMRRDPASGSGHLDSPDQDKPNGVTALAFKARALLYDASPLNNTANDLTRWQAAAEACGTALETALSYGYTLLGEDEYTRNFYGVKYTNEQLWANSPGSLPGNDSSLETYMPFVFNGRPNASGQCPTENFIRYFETADGYPLNTEEQRQAATQAGQWNEQDPYVHRDPRFDVVIIYNQKVLDMGSAYGTYASLYVEDDGQDTRPAGSLMPLTPEDRYTRTGYYECKRTGKMSASGSVQSQILTDPIIRLAELYLSYAEACNEAYGPNGSATTSSMTALQALNTIRNRIGMPDVLAEFTGSTNALRPRIKNERTVELCFEGFHYWCDIRRWMDAPEIYRGRLLGIKAVRLADENLDPELYPTGFKYSTYELDANRQVAWVNDGMNYIPFTTAELQKMKNYVPNQAW